MIRPARSNDEDPAALLALVHAGESEQACARIDGIFARSDSDPIQYQDLINVLLEIPDYQRAKRVFARYRSSTGNELVSDFSLEDIEREERKEIEAEQAYAKQETKVFQPAPIWQRGFFKRLLSLNPVTSITISPEALTIKKRFSAEKQYRWHEISSASMTNARISHVHGGMELRRTIGISSGSDSYEFDVSQHNADFQHARILLAELQKHLSVSISYCG